MTTAVIRTGGKQYVVHEGDSIKVEKITTEAGKSVEFDDVLLTATDRATHVGAPQVSKAQVTGEVIGHSRYRKVTGVKMKAKKRNRKLFGHKQPYTEVKITKIKTI